MEENVPLLNSNITSTVNDSTALFKLQQNLKEKRYGCCVNVQPLSTAKVVNTRDMSGYVIHLWTLIENRWTRQDMAPCYGDEVLPNKPLGNIWKDYQFNLPTETLLPNQKIRHDVRDLYDTKQKQRCTKCDCQGRILCTSCKGYGHLKCALCEQEGGIECCTEEKCTKCSGRGVYVCQKCGGHGKYDCSECLSHGQVQCPQCKGQKFVLVWTRLHVKWYNVNSTVIHKPDVRCILPSSEIERTTDKVTCLVHDNLWPSSMESIDDILNTCVGLPDECRIAINEEYRNVHCKKSGQIRRIRCVIQRLKIKEIEYKLEKIKDETFIFCLYGEDEIKVYENQYPYRFCGLRYPSSCLLM